MHSLLTEANDIWIGWYLQCGFPFCLNTFVLLREYITTIVVEAHGEELVNMKMFIFPQLFRNRIPEIILTPFHFLLLLIFPLDNMPLILSDGISSKVNWFLVDGIKQSIIAKDKY